MLTPEQITRARFNAADLAEWPTVREALDAYERIAAVAGVCGIDELSGRECVVGIYRLRELLDGPQPAPGNQTEGE